MLLKTTISLLLLLLLGACSSYNDVDKTPSVVGDIEDNASWYEDMQDDILEIRVAIPIPNEYDCVPFDNRTAPSRPCTLADINGDIDANDDYEPLLHVKLETDDFLSPSESVNASFEQKGKSTREAEQKSYRIKLDSKTNLYNQERTFQLNKHKFDYSRVRNKLAFDLFRDMPNFTSLKTQFVNLWIDGQDYGLFTHVEKVGKEFLLNRGWNKDDNLYKAQNFDFRMHQDLELNADGKPLNPQAFDKIIEVERGKKQTKLIEMLNNINQDNLSDADFEKIFNKYFNRNNYITWMAINIVTANKDTNTQNFFLLNPLNSDTFYFLPWDYDGAGLDNSLYSKWELGIGTWWDIPLHKGFLKIKKNRDDLEEMVNNLREKYITPAILQGRINTYAALIQPYIENLPDKEYLDFQRWKNEVNILVPRLDENIQNYKNQEGVPMPYWQRVSYKEEILTLEWDKVVDFENDALVYDIEVSDNYDFNTTLISLSNIDQNSSLLVQGQFSTSYKENIELTPQKSYYLKVVAKEKENYNSYQIAFDNEVQGLHSTIKFGVLEFTVE